MTPPSCFTRHPKLAFPDLAKVRARLTNGEVGRRLYDAVVGDDVAAAQHLLRDDPRLATTMVAQSPVADGDGDLLTFAVVACLPEMVAALLDAGLAPDGMQPGLALGFALLCDTPVMAELLLRAGASPDPQKRGGENVFATVASFGQRGAALMLLRHGLDLGWVDRFGRGHLETAVAMAQFEIAEDLMHAGASAWRVSMGGFMPAQAIAAALPHRDPVQEAARQRLAAALPHPALPWPPPAPPLVAAQVAQGRWPTEAMAEAGMMVTAGALADIRSRQDAWRQ